MKISLKILSVIAYILVIQGCAITNPCVPYNAQAITDWATGVKNASKEGHGRKAEVANNNGNINCRMQEVASSERGEPQPPPQPPQMFRYSPYGYMY